MASSSDVNQLAIDAKAAILQKIIGMINQGGSDTVRSMAEAYAWIANPDQPH